MNKKLIIGFMGRKRAGKSTACQFLQEIDPDNIAILSFAEPLKQVCKMLFMLNDQQLYGDLKDVVDERWGKTPRRLFELTGTDFVRYMVDVDFWIKRMAESIRAAAEPVILVDDARFSNEAELLLKIGARDSAVVVVANPEVDKTKITHISDAPAIEAATDIIYNDGSLAKYRTTVEQSEYSEIIRRHLNAAC